MIIFNCLVLGWLVGLTVMALGIMKNQRIMGTAIVKMLTPRTQKNVKRAGPITNPPNNPQAT